MPIDNIILATDSYKLNHWAQYPEGTTGVFSYLEARQGAQFDRTVFFGLQSILQDLAGVVVTEEDIDAADELAQAHFGMPLFNRKGWEFVVRECDGQLPVRIKAVAEGTPVPNGNVLMTVENTRPEAFWLTNALESLLLHVWYPTTVASLSRNTKRMMLEYLEKSSDAPEAGIQFMLHDFGYRGAATHDAAAIGGAGHLVNFWGTDTIPAIQLAMRDYDADFADGPVGLSVPATEHSVMTALGKDGEYAQVDRLLENYPAGILSVVADSFSIYNFLDYIATYEVKMKIMARDGKFVVRPDSNTLRHPQPESQVEYILHNLYGTFGGVVNSKGYKVLDPHVGVLWGDGVGPDGIERIIKQAVQAGFSAENLVFGMGGGLLQKVNRDTQRFAFKSSAQERGGEWHDVSKSPLDKSKGSKAGRLRLLTNGQGGFETVREDRSEAPFKGITDALETVFEDGVITRRQTFEEVRANASL